MEALSRSVEQSRSRGKQGAGSKAGKAGRGGKAGERREGDGAPGGRKSAARRERSGEPASLSKAELYERASAADVPGRSRMTREHLIEALTRAGAAA
ncbi:hypothetical protein [Streptomyces eurythermus]|uniref:hypothetical protein n=1 Tax=Streptomyces eurythermus TaxID=42237 RepID=UPI0036D284D5